MVHVASCFKVNELLHSGVVVARWLDGTTAQGTSNVVNMGMHAVPHGVTIHLGHIMSSCACMLHACCQSSPVNGDSAPGRGPALNIAGSRTHYTPHNLVGL